MNIRRWIPYKRCVHRHRTSFRSILLSTDRPQLGAHDIWEGDGPPWQTGVGLVRVWSTPGCANASVLAVLHWTHTGEHDGVPVYASYTGTANA